MDFAVFAYGEQLPGKLIHCLAHFKQCNKRTTCTSVCMYSTGSIMYGSLSLDTIIILCCHMLGIQPGSQPLTLILLLSCPLKCYSYDYAPVSPMIRGHSPELWFYFIVHNHLAFVFNNKTLELIVLCQPAFSFHPYMYMYCSFNAGHIHTE